jgi:tRNA (guanine37-N1)-methyltransferase
MAFDVIGDIAIVDEIENKKDEKKVADQLRKTHPHLKTVMMKTGGREGDFRTRSLKKLWGDGTETTQVEYGMRFKLDVSTCYFSPRELTERQRIAKEVSPRETVMVMFGGVAPFAIAIARGQPKVSKVISVELNPDCAPYAEENIRMNQCRYVVEHVTGDVAKACRPFFGKCDRVVMPLPREGFKFLPVAAACLKPKGGVIHFYYVSTGESMFKEATEVAKSQISRVGRKVKVVGQHKVLPFGPGKFKICLDLEVC